MKVIFRAAGPLLVSFLLTYGYAQEPVEYTEPPQVLLVLSQALEDLDNGKATLIGRKSAYEAIKLAGFRVNKIVAINMGTNIHLQLEIVGPNGEKLRDWQGNQIPSTFAMRAPYDTWKNLVE